MSTLKDDIEKTRYELVQVTQALERQLQTIDDEASRRRRAAISEADTAKGELSLRLARLMIAETMITDKLHPDLVARQAAAVSGTERKPATSTILEVLASSEEGVLPDVLVQAVVASGWTRSAAEKARTRMLAAGYVDRDENGHYKITERGILRLNSG